MLLHEFLTCFTYLNALEMKCINALKMKCRNALEINGMNLKYMACRNHDDEWNAYGYDEHVWT
jgi:hypothetical protein